MGKVHQIIDAVVALVPEYFANPDDRNISGGNWAICIKYLLTVVLWFCLLSFGAKAGSNTVRGKIKIEDKQREYIVYLPAKLPENSPLVFVIHGYTDNAQNMMNSTGFNAIADDNKFAVCYPQGLKDKGGNTFWEVGYSFTRALEVNDVEFLTELAGFLQKKYRLSKVKTFATGHSNGAELSIVLACKTPDVFKAVAPVCGCIMKSVYDESQNSKPIPIFMINSTADKTTWWNGDIPNNQGYGSYLSTPDLLKFFVEKNKCTQIKVDTIPDINKQDSCFVISERHFNNINGNEVLFYKVVNGGHDWPDWSGNRDINASREVWNFFKKY
jgi:polyhydroxybutyrate depolymerase